MIRLPFLRLWLLTFFLGCCCCQETLALFWTPPTSPAPPPAEPAPPPPPPPPPPPQDTFFSSSGDPSCSTGVPGQGRSRGVCCAATCGVGNCGGVGCGNNPAGRDNCCTGAIVNANRSCRDHPPPCRLDHFQMCQAAGQTPQDPLDVLVIGAGWSGLAAGYRLLTSQTTNFCILEGRHEMGGRSRTMMGYFQDGLPTELGSGWIYPGSNVFSVFQSAGLITNVVSVFDFSQTGLYVEPTATSAGGLLVNDQDLRGAYADFIDYAQKNARHDVSMAAVKDAYLAQQGATLTNLQRTAIDTIVTMITHTEWGAYMTEQDSETMMQYLDYDYTINYAGIPGSGFKPALEHLAAPFAQQHIQFHQQVTEIDYASTPNGIVKVTSIDRTTNTTNIRYARAVICTVSLGVLKHGDLRFVPALPVNKQQAIQRMAFGQKNKCWLYWDPYNNPGLDLSWWPHGRDEMLLITQDNNPESNNEWTMFYNDQNHRGNENIFVLSAWIGGVESDRFEQKTDAEILSHVMANLRKMFPTYNVPDPTNHLITRWKSDPFTRGTYSYYSVGVDYGATARALGEPVGNNLYFAGEATWPNGMGAPSAFSSGEAAVQDIAQSGVLSNNIAVPVPVPPVTIPATPVPVPVPATPPPLPIPATPPPVSNPQVITISPITPSLPMITPAPAPLDDQETEDWDFSDWLPPPATAPPTMTTGPIATTPAPTLAPTTADWNFVDWFTGLLSNAQEETPSPTQQPLLRSPTTMPSQSGSWP